jgi:hypothetical protein
VSNPSTTDEARELDARQDRLWAFMESNPEFTRLSSAERKCLNRQNVLLAFHRKVLTERKRVVKVPSFTFSR